jgi:hypothetical protein
MDRARIRREGSPAGRGGRPLRPIRPEDVYERGSAAAVWVVSRSRERRRYLNSEADLTDVGRLFSFVPRLS